MTSLWTVAEAVTATGGRAERLADGDLSSVSIDSREIEPGALFVAIKGDKLDGHDYVKTALDAGASAALVSQAWFKTNGGEKLIVVADPLEGLRGLARAARARTTAKIVAVTGSAGKTTTKEAIRTVLSAAGPTHYSIKSFNNHWGVPLMLARMPREAEYGGFEIGMNHAGEITPLVQMVRPHIAVITTVAAAHLEFFKSVTEIAEAKAEIFLGVDDHHAGGHRRMGVAAKLGAIDLVMANGGRFEPDRHAHARNRILSHAHRYHLERMDDISRTYIRHHGLVHDHMHFTEGQLNVVLAIRIGWVDAESIG